MGGFMTARGTSNLLTRTTAILAALFLGISLLLAVLGTSSRERRPFMDTLTPGVPAPSSPATPAAPAEPAAPIAR
jgi:preprotein translocase subunit SecG